MLNWSRFQCTFSTNWRFGLLALIFFALFVRIGIWQLARADEKRQMLQEQHRLMQDAPVDVSSGTVTPKPYQPIRVRGRYLSVSFLLDNQFYHHQFGYDVLSPLLLDNGQVIFINRGWVAGDPRRVLNPEIKVPQGSQELTGTAYFPSGKQWSVGQIFDKKAPLLIVIEIFNARLLTQFLHKSVYPFMMRLDAKAPNGFVREWSVVSMPPERHMAYAMQWFAFAALAIILFVVLNIKKK